MKTAGMHSVWNVRERLEENFRRVEALLREMEVADDPKMRLAAAAELRQHIALAQKTLETAARAEAVQAFEEAVMEALEAANVTVRHIALAQKTLETAARAEAVQAFEEAVMEALEAANVTVRRRVIDVLNERADSAGLLRPSE